MSDQEQSFGQKAVGLSFNHAEGATHDKVHELKSLYAKIIDILHEDRTDIKSGAPLRDERARHASVAITDAETAQMRAVKAVTFGRDEA